MTETAISKSVGELLTANKIINWRASVFSGKTQSGRYLKTGTPGLPDRAFFMNDGSGKTVYLEVKTPKGVQSQVQKDFQKECDVREIPYFMVRSVEDVKEILEALDMLKVRM